MHDQRRAWVVGEHVHRHVVGRVLAPPAAPALIPRARTAAEHVPPHDVGPDIVEDLFDDLRVGVALAALHPLLGAPRARLERPLVQAHAAFADGVLLALIRPRDEAVQRDRDLAAHAHARIIAPRPARGPRGRPPGAPPRGRPASCVSCLPSAWSRAFSCA